MAILLAIRCARARSHRCVKRTASSSSSKKALNRRRPQTPHHSRAARDTGRKSSCCLYSGFSSDPSVWLRTCILLLGLAALALLALELVTPLVGYTAAGHLGRGSSSGGVTPETVLLVIINSSTTTTSTEGTDEATSSAVASTVGVESSSQNYRTGATTRMQTTSTVPPPPFTAIRAVRSSPVPNLLHWPAGGGEVASDALLVVDLLEFAFIAIQLYYVCASTRVSVCGIF